MPVTLLIVRRAPDALRVRLELVQLTMSVRASEACRDASPRESMGSNAVDVRDLLRAIEVLAVTVGRVRGVNALRRRYAALIELGKQQAFVPVHWLEEGGAARGGNIGQAQRLSW